jgi:hypothetical protein
MLPVPTTLDDRFGCGTSDWPGLSHKHALAVFFASDLNSTTAACHAALPRSAPLVESMLRVQRWRDAHSASTHLAAQGTRHAPQPQAKVACSEHTPVALGPTAGCTHWLVHARDAHHTHTHTRTHAHTHTRTRAHPWSYSSTATQACVQVYSRAGHTLPWCAVTDTARHWRTAQCPARTHSPPFPPTPHVHARHQAPPPLLPRTAQPHTTNNNTMHARRAS